MYYTPVNNYRSNRENSYKDHYHGAEKAGTDGEHPQSVHLTSYKNLPRQSASIDGIDRQAVNQRVRSDNKNQLIQNIKAILKRLLMPSP